VYDVIIVGGSFAGLAAAMQLARARRKLLILDAGQPRNRFASHAHGVLGHDGRPPFELIAAAREQILRYPTVRHQAGTAASAERTDEGIVVTYGSNEQAHGRRLVLATGVVDQLPAVAGVAERWGAGVMHCPYCHGFEVADGRLGVLATGPGSLHQAKLIRDWSDRLTLFTNGIVALSDDERAALAARGIAIDERPVAEVRGAGHSVEAVAFHDGGSVPLDGLFVASSTRLASPLAEQLGCAIEAGPLGPVIATDARKETSVPGVFAAGDAARPMHNITLAMADGVLAGSGAHQSLLGFQPPAPSR
jgi:thioredoxin reductase